MQQSTRITRDRSFEDALKTVSFYADKTWFIPAPDHSSESRPTSIIPGFDPIFSFLIANQHLWVRLKSTDFDCLYPSRRLRDSRSFPSSSSAKMSMVPLAKNSQKYNPRLFLSSKPYQMFFHVKFRTNEKLLHQEKSINKNIVSQSIPNSRLAIYAGNHCYNENHEKYYIGDLDIDQKVYPNGSTITSEDFADLKICYNSKFKSRPLECWMFPEVQEKCRKLLSSPKLDDEPLDEWEAEILNRHPAVLGRLWARRFTLVDTPWTLFSPPPPPNDLAKYPIRQYSIGEFSELQILHSLNSERIRSLWKWPPVVQPPILAFCLPEMPSMIRPEPGYQQSLFPYLTKIPTSSAVSQIPVYTRPLELYHQEQRRRTAGVDFRNLIPLTPSPEYSTRTVNQECLHPFGFFPNGFLPPFPVPSFPPPLLIHNLTTSYGMPIYGFHLHRNIALEQPPPPGTEEDFTLQEMKKRYCGFQPLEELSERLSKLEEELLAIDSALENHSVEHKDLVERKTSTISELVYTSESPQNFGANLEIDSSCTLDVSTDPPRRLYRDVLTGYCSINDWNPKDQPPIPGESNSPLKDESQKAINLEVSFEFNEKESHISDLVVISSNSFETNVNLTGKHDNPNGVVDIEKSSPMNEEQHHQQETFKILPIEEFPSLPSPPVAKSSPTSSPGSWPSSPLYSSDTRSISSDQSPSNNNMTLFCNSSNNNNNFNNIINNNNNNNNNLSRNSKRNRAKRLKGKKKYSSESNASDSIDAVYFYEKSHTLPEIRGMMPIDALDILSIYVHDCSYSFQTFGGMSQIPVLVPPYNLLNINMIFYDIRKIDNSHSWPEIDFYLSFINRLSELWWKNDNIRNCGELFERPSYIRSLESCGINQSIT